MKGIVSVLFQLEVRRYNWQSGTQKEKMTKENEVIIHRQMKYSD